MKLRGEDIYRENGRWMREQWEIRKETTVEKVLFIEGYTRDLGLPEDVWAKFKAGAIELWNAPRPLPGRFLKGEFLHGIFYAVVDPRRMYADMLRDGCRQQNAWPLEYVTEETVRAYFHAKAVEYKIDQEEENSFDYAEMVSSYVNHRNHDDD